MVSQLLLSFQRHAVNGACSCACFLCLCLPLFVCLFGVLGCVVLIFHVCMIACLFTSASFQPSKIDAKLKRVMMVMMNILWRLPHCLYTHTHVDEEEDEATYSACQCLDTIIAVVDVREATPLSHYITLLSPHHIALHCIVTLTRLSLMRTNNNHNNSLCT